MHNQNQNKNENLNRTKNQTRFRFKLEPEPKPKHQKKKKTQIKKTHKNKKWTRPNLDFLVHRMNKWVNEWVSEVKNCQVLNDPTIHSDVDFLNLRSTEVCDSLLDLDAKVDTILS